MGQLLEELSILVDNPGRGENGQPLISEYYKELVRLEEERSVQNICYFTNKIPKFIYK
jgi:hypothetical protein